MYEVSRVQVDQSTVKRKIERYLERNNKDKGFADKFVKMEGCCLGISVLWLYAKWLQTQPKADFSIKYSGESESQKLTPNDDYEWFKSTIELIADWDEKRSLTPDESKQFERFASLVEYYQNIYEHVTSTHQHSLEGYLEDPRKGTAKKEYSIASLFTLEQLKQLLKTENFIQDDKLILIGSHNYSTGLFKKEGINHYFDSNSYDGEVQTTSTDELAKLIFEANFYNLGKGNCKIVVPYYTKPSPLEFMMFSFDERNAKYPTQQDVLNSINPSLISVKKHAYEETGLTKAASIGCLESVRYFLSKKANPNAQGRYTALMYASARGYIDIVTELLAVGANPNVVLNPINSKDNCWIAIMLASYAGYADIVTKLLVAGADPNKYDSFGITPLITAVIRNKASVVKALVEDQSLNPNLKDKGKTGHTALMYAAIENKAEIAKVLLTNPKIDLNVRNDSGGCTAIMLAVMHDSIDVVKTLLTNQSVDLSIKGKKINSTPFMLAVEHNKIEIVKLFLASERVNLDARDERGMTALMRAAINGYTDIVKDLFAAGADPNLVNTVASSGYGIWSALMMAADRGHIEVIKVFLTNKNVNCNMQDKQGMTALIAAAMNNQVESAETLLTDSNIDPNIRCGFSGKTALICAAENNYTEIVKILLANRNVDPNIKDKFLGKTPLMYAAQNNHIETVKILLAAPNVDPNIVDDFGGWTALIWAVVKGDNLETIKALLTNKAINLNIQTVYGSTALISAVIKNNLDVVKALMANQNIDLDIIADDGKTAFDNAKSDEMRQLLKKPTTAEYMASHNLKVICSEKENE